MTEPKIVMTEGRVIGLSTLHRTRRALEEFLAIPLLLILGFAALALLLQHLDRNTPGWLQPLRRYLSERIFTTPDSSGEFLDTVGAGMFTQVSIVITMLLVVLQQSATNMGNSVFDQFLNRHRNQVFTGYVTGTLIMTLILKAITSDSVNPVLSASAVLAVVFFLMGFFVWFLYSIIEQMRPETIAATVHDETDDARQRHIKNLARFRSHAESEAPVQVRLRSSDNGFVTTIFPDKLDSCFKECGDDIEVVLHAHVGDYISYSEDLADIRGNDSVQAEAVARCIIGAYRIERERSIRSDPTYGLEQLEMIAWTEVSSAEHNPETGLIVLHLLHDLLARWLDSDSTNLATTSLRDEKKLPVVYAPENIVDQMMDIMESLATVSSESRQHQVLTEVINVIAALYPDLGPEHQERADDALRRILSTMGAHVLTRDLDVALHALTQRLEADHHLQIADTVATAHMKLADSVGKLGSRMTRAGEPSSNGH
jgi:uncharacterized membrane protein